MPAPRIISLFTGAGGLDYGFEAAHFDTAAAVEFDPTACATLRQNRRCPVIERDIFKAPTAEILEVGGLQWVRTRPTRVPAAATARSGAPVLLSRSSRLTNDSCIPRAPLVACARAQGA